MFVPDAEVCFPLSSVVLTVRLMLTDLAQSCCCMAMDPIAGPGDHQVVASGSCDGTATTPY
jgi:hypothetical protein